LGIALLKAVIFDLDGVIVKFNLNSRRIKEEMIAELEASGIPKGS
jgi:beta-phosphoglucomutase-like phosphatase (HAD superfamily)